MITDIRTLGDLIDRAADRWPHHEAIVHEGKAISYGTLKENADCLAGALWKLGVRKGDKVSVLLTNLPQWAYAEFAIDKLGAVVVPINTRYSLSELEHILSHSDSTTLITMDRFQQTDYIHLLRQICPELDEAEPGNLKSAKLPFLRNVVVYGRALQKGTFDFDKLIRGTTDKELQAAAEAQALVAPEDIAHMPYTSGTTGRPKGVMTTHMQYIRFNLGFIEGIGGFGERDRLLVAPPFSHNFGNSQGILTPAFCGAASILIETFDARRCLELIQEEQCTFFAGSPTMYIRMLREDDFSRYDLSSLRAGLIAAAPAPVAIIKEIQSKMGVTILVNGFGMTENSVGTSMTRPGDSPEVLSETVGKPIWPDYEVKVVDIQTGKDLLRGEEGELCTRGPLIMKGYYKMPEETAELIDNESWFHTGDMAVIDEAGYIRITGRMKDIYMPGGLNVSPEEVEDVIFTHPGVKQVTVLGVPDEDLGEAGAAFVEMKEGHKAPGQEIINHCKGRIAGFKIPKYIFFTDDFPMTASGKVQRFVLKDRAVKELGLGKS